MWVQNGFWFPVCSCRYFEAFPCEWQLMKVLEFSFFLKVLYIFPWAFGDFILFSIYFHARRASGWEMIHCHLALAVMRSHKKQAAPALMNHDSCWSIHLLKLKKGRMFVRFLVNKISCQHSSQAKSLRNLCFCEWYVGFRTHRSSKREVLPADFFPSFFVRKVLDFLSYLGGKDPLGRD